MGKRRRRESLPSKREEPVDRRASARLPSPHALLSAFALVLLVAGARWWLIGRYGTDVPWLDQWDAEAQGLYQPWYAGTLHLQSWFAAHNEHRIVLTRVLSLGLLALNGQWDPRLQMVVNAGLYAIVFGALFLVFQKRRPPGFQIFCWLLLAVLGSAPYAATNTLLGFQSAFYFLAGFSLLTIYALSNGRSGSLLWIAGAVAGFAALFSMASGYAADLAVLGVLLCSALRSANEIRQTLVRNWITIAAACGLSAVGLLLRYNPPGHAAMAAKSAADFGWFALACLSWPGKPMLPLALVTWIPFGAFLFNYLRRRTPDDDAGRFILGASFWVLLQAAGLAFYRANSGEGLESRYSDILAFGLLANAICAVWLVASGGNLRRWTQVLAILWFAVSGIGLYDASFDGTASSWKQSMEIRRAATAGFLATGDERYLDRAPPYPDAKHIAALLVDRSLAPVLPAGIRKPLALLPRRGSPAPEYVSGMSMPDFGNVSSDVWALPGMFSHFAWIPPSTEYEYQVEAKGGPPFLLLYFLGDHHEAAVADSRQARHTIVLLPSGQDHQGHHAFVYCPTGQCIINGSSGPSQFAIMEPKQIGFLSIVALVAVIRVLLFPLFAKHSRSMRQMQLLQPFITFALASIFIGEPITPQILLFASAVVVTVAISTRTRSRPVAAPEG